MLSKVKSNCFKVGNIPANTICVLCLAAALLAIIKVSLISFSSFLKQLPLSSHGVKLASKLNLANSKVNLSSLMSLSISTDLQAGEKFLSTRNISCSAPIRVIPDSIMSFSIIISRAFKSFRTARIKRLRSRSDCSLDMFISPIITPYFYPYPYSCFLI